MAHDLVLRGGRVIDPETGLDAICDVAIDGATIAAVGEDLAGHTTIDVAGRVVAPGFIDLHSHAATLPGRRLQACDGVTSVLDLEAGRAPLDLAYERDAQRGSPIHYGYSASWGAARMHVMTGMPLTGDIGAMMAGLGDPRWQEAASPDQLTQILDRISSDVAGGGVGIGVLAGYAPGVDPEEYLAVSRIAADAGIPTFTHCRDLVEFAPDALIDGAEEIVRAAGTTGVHAHYCHVNSTSIQHIDRVLALIDRCRSEGGRVTTEAYPYGSGATGIGAAFLAPERLAERGMTPRSLLYLPTGERVVDDRRLAELRATDPGGAVIVEFLDESDPHDMAVLRRSLNYPDSIVASDSMPVLWSDRSAIDTEEWPLPPGGSTHPRTAGCFSRALRLWRTEKTPLVDAIERCTLLPAQALESAVPEMKRKGRVQMGADADLVVFDAELVTDQATYTDSTRPSTGITHVVVDGTFVVRDGALVPEALPGRPIRARPA